MMKNYTLKMFKPEKFLFEKNACFFIFCPENDKICTLGKQSKRFFALRLGQPLAPPILVGASLGSQSLGVQVLD